jgi:hypothetical protein
MARLLNDGTTAVALQHRFRPIKKEGDNMKASTPTLRSLIGLHPLSSTLQDVSFRADRLPLRSSIFLRQISLRFSPPVINHSRFY